MDIVLGVSMAPDSIHIVLLQGENADGATVDEKEFTGSTAEDSPTISASDRALAAILATRNDAAAAGLELSAVGVAYTDRLDATALRAVLAARELENVMLVSAFTAATALTQFLGGAIGYERTAVLFVEPDTATLAVVETADGSVTDVRTIETAELLEIVAGLDELPERPDGLFVVGSGVDIAAIKPQLDAATSLAVTVPEEPETALARGAALASATLFASETAALAYAQDPGTGSLGASSIPEYLSVADTEQGDEDVAYSAVADEEASAPTVVIDPSEANAPRRRRVLLVGTAVTVGAISAALALEVALGLGLRTTVGLLPAPIQNFIAPVEHAIVPQLGPMATKEAVSPKPLTQPVGAPMPAGRLPAAAAVPVPGAPGVPIPVVIPPIAPPPAPQVILPDTPASPPAVQAPMQPSSPADSSPPADSPQPLQVPPPQAPPPNQPPPDQGPQPAPGRGGGHPGNPGDGGPVSGPGPIHGAPGGGGPHGGGPANGPGPGHGAPGGPPPEGSGPAGGGEPHSGGPGHGTPGGAPPEGTGPVGGGEPHSGSGPAGGGEPHSGGGPAGGGNVPESSGPAGGGNVPESSGPAGGGNVPESSGPAGGGNVPESSGPASVPDSSPPASGGSDIPDSSGPASSPSDSGGSSPSDSGSSSPSDSGSSSPSDSGSSDSGSSDSGSVSSGDDG
jgi:hypothetical protein